MSTFSRYARTARRGVITLIFGVLLPLLLCPHVHAQGIDDGLVGYWPFDAENPTADQSGNGNAATLGSGLQLTTDVAPTAFVNTSALRSTSNPNSYATAPGNGIDKLTDYTVAFWLRVNGAATGTGDVVALGNRIVIQVRKLQSGQFILDVRFPLRVYPYPVEAVLESNGWNHVAVTVQGSETNIYFNGQRAQNETYPAGSSGIPSSGIYFSSSNTPLNGILDDVRIYNRVLTASEIAALPYNCNNSNGLSAPECQALVNHFRNTDGMKWTNHTNWLQNNTPCTWFGVLCNNGHVFALNLPQNNLRGEMTFWLGGLPELVVLNLANNQLTGAIPFELGSLSKLQTLDLYGNRLSGQLPFTLGGLRALTTLRLYHNQLRGSIPSQLTQLTSLLTLDLGYNTLRADDPALLNFLTTQQPDWAATQTVAPSNLRATVSAATSVTVTWQPISYTADVGYYEVFMAPQAAGPYTRVGVTTDKRASSLTVTDLPSGATRYFLVRTFTAKHGLQQNDLLSDSTDPVAVTLTVNQPPMATNDRYTIPQAGALTVDAAHGLLANDRDPDGNPLHIGSISSVTPGSQLALNPDGSFTYAPAPGFVGTETFTYQASDGQALSNPATVTFQVQANAAPATITIVLDVQPKSKTNFRFGGDLGAFQLDDITPQDADAFNNRKPFTVAAGSYTVNLTLPKGYLQANSSCNPTTGTIVDLASHQITINATAGANITCTFSVQRAGQLIAGKYADRNHNHLRSNNEPWLNGWQMQLYNAINPQPTVQTTAGEGRTLFTDLLPGVYTICEVQQPSWVAITPNALHPTYQAPCYTVMVEPGKAVWSRFGNSNTPVAAATETPFSDIIICDLPATDDEGNELAAERDPWEEEEQATAQALFLPLIQH